MKTNKNNSKHELLLSALLISPTVREAAASCKIPESTAYRIMREPEFAKELKMRKREMVQEAQEYLKTRITAATQTLDEIRADENVLAQSRVSACRCLLEFATKAVELTDIIERIEALEAATLGDNDT